MKFLTSRTAATTIAPGFMGFAWLLVMTGIDLMRIQ
jgi:hypothetical protein